VVSGDIADLVANEGLGLPGEEIEDYGVVRLS
jgi:hypothetical protein